VIAEVEQAKDRSEMPRRKSLSILGVPVTTYYRWLREAAWEKEKSPPIKPVQVFEALPEEKLAVTKYALEHPEIRHRELAWRMVDDDVAYLSPSTVYRILLAESLMNRHRGRVKRYREEQEKAAYPDHIWATDFMYLKVQDEQFFVVTYIDEYSRYLVHWEILSTVDATAISTSAQAALQTLPQASDGTSSIKPIIRSDNGSGYVSGEFAGLLSFHGLTHHRIKPHCPEENGVMERANRTLREKLDEHELTGREQAQEVLTSIIANYNNQRLHSSLGYKPPATYYRGNPEAVDDARALKLRQARHKRRQANLKLRQKTLPLEATKDIA
jgi:putative transposase